MSFVDLLDGRVPPGVLRGRIVIVGETAPSGQDLHPSPFGVISGPEVQANALATILNGFPLRDVAGWVTVLLIVALALLPPLAAVRRGALATLAVAVAALVALTVGSQLAFDAGRVIDYTDALLALGVSSVATVGVDYAVQNRERNRLRELFAAFSPEVVDQVLAQSDVQGGVGALKLSATAVIGGYRMEEVVGRGAMGVVYKATQLALERPVAIKVISPEHARDPSFQARFERESRLAASVEHPNVIPVYEAGEDDGLLFIAMRYVDGVDLGVTVERLGPLAPLRAAAIVAQVAVSARRRARARPGAPRREAGEHPAGLRGARARLPDRLRRGEDHDQPGRHDDHPRPVGRDRRLHRARAAAGRAGRRARGHLRARRRAASTR